MDLGRADDPLRLQSGDTESTGGDPDQPLPRGKHNLSRDKVIQNQRRRMLVAAGSAWAEKGYWRLTVSDIASGAGVSRATFYAQFNDKLDCLLCAHRAAFDGLRSEIGAACASAESWPGNAAAAIDAVVRFVAANPGYASLLTMSAAGAHPDLGEQVLLRHEELAGWLRRARDGAADLAGVPPVTDEVAIGGSATFIAHVLHRDGSGELMRQTPALVRVLLALYAQPQSLKE